MALKLKKGNKVASLFFSKNEKGTCTVRALWEDLNNNKHSFLFFFLQHYSVFLIEKHYEKQSIFLKSQGVKNVDSSRLIIFGHRDEEYPALDSVGGDSFGPEWFDQLYPKTVVVMFVPGGSQILDRQEWANKVKKYVSFKSKFSLLRDIPVLRDEGRILFPQLIECTYATNDPKEIVQKFSFHFLETMKKLKKNPNLTYGDKRLSSHLLWLNDINLTFKDRSA